MNTPLTPAPRALFNLAFRPFFLFGALFFVLALGRWGLFLGGHIDWSGSLDPITWHVHEMTLGFGLAIVLGFLLTAVQNWTGLPSVSRPTLKILIVLWLGGRALLWWAPDWPILLLALPDTLCLILAAIGFARPVLRRRQWRNTVFLPAFAALLALHLAVLMPSLSLDGSALLWCIALFMSVIGGRIIPLFTANRFGLVKPTEPQWTYWALIALTLLVIGWVALGGIDTVSGRLTLALLAAFHGVRAGRWYHHCIWRDSLIWTLHVSYWALPMTALGMALSGPASALGHALQHLLALQGISLMILSMMSRVSLGHTGRRLASPIWLGPAAAGLLAAMAVRVLMPVFWPLQTTLGHQLASALGVAALMAFIVHYTPILISPRADGKPG